MNDSGFIGFPQNERHKVSTALTMQRAVEILVERRRRAFYEYPGYISIEGFAFGDAGGAEYGWNREDGKEVIQPVTEPSQPLTATAEDLAGWIFRVVREQKELGRVYSVLPPYTGSQTYPVAYRQAPGESGPGECFAIVAEFNGDGGAGDEGSRTARRFVEAINERAALVAVAEAAKVLDEARTTATADAYACFEGRLSKALGRLAALRIQSAGLETGGAK